MAKPQISTSVIVIALALMALTLMPFMSAQTDFAYNRLYENNELLPGFNFSINVNSSDFWNTLSLGPLRDANSSLFFAVNNVLNINTSFLQNITGGDFLRLDGTNVPLANYNWITDLNTTGAVNPNIITVNQSLVIRHAITGGFIDNNAGNLNLRNLDSTSNINFFVENYTNGNDPSFILRSGGGLSWNSEGQAFPNFVLSNSGGLAMVVHSGSNQINFSNSNFIVEADGKLTIDVDGEDLIRMGELQEARIGYNGTDLLIDSAFAGGGRLIINRNGAGVDIGRDAVDVPFNVFGVSNFTVVNGDRVTILAEDEAVLFVNSADRGFPSARFVDGVYNIVVGDGLGSGNAIEISGGDISIDADGQINLDSAEDQRILRLQAFNTQTQDIMAVQDSSGNDFLVVNGSGTLELTNSPVSINATGNIITNATGIFGEIIDNGLNISSTVYTDANKQLTSTAPTSGVIGYWNRSGTTLFPANLNDGVTVNGSTRFGANDSIIHSMNTGPVANTMLRRDYAFGTTNTVSNMIFDSYANSVDTTVNSPTIMHSAQFSVSGADSGLFQGKTSVGHSIIVSDSSVLTNSNIHFTVATDSRVTFTGTNTANTIARMIGASYVVGGNMGTNGQAEHIGAQFTAQSTADQNTGGTFLSSGATNNIGATFTAQGSHTTNVGAIFLASGATNNYGFYVSTTGTKNAIGTATPLAALDISGTANDIQLLVSGSSAQSLDLVVVEDFSGNELMSIGTIDVIFNEGGFNIDHRIEAQGVPNAFALEGSNGNIIAGGAIFTIGSGFFGVDPQIFFDGQSNDGFIQYMEDEDALFTNDKLWLGSNNLIWKFDLTETTVLTNGTGSSTEDLSQANAARVIFNTGASESLKFVAAPAMFVSNFYTNDNDLEGDFLIGLHGDILINGAGNIGPMAIAGLWGSITYNGTGTSIDTIMGVRGENTVNSGSGVRIADFYAATPELNGGTTSNSYGMFLEDIDNTGATTATEVWQIYSVNGDWRIGNDNSELFFGTGQDASINYDGFNFLISPKRVGGAIVIVEGGMQINEDLNVLGDLDVNGDLNVTGNFNVQGNYTLNGNVVISENATCRFFYSTLGGTIFELCEP